MEVRKGAHAVYQLKYHGSARGNLFHFHGIGLLLFIVSDFIMGREQVEDMTKVTIIREKLLNYLQYQSRVFLTAKKRMFSSQVSRLSNDNN